MILDVLKEFIEQNKLSGEKIGVACSGGIDSMVLLDTMTKLHPKEKLVCLHLDHGWSEESVKALKLVENYCSTKSIMFVSKSYELGQMEKKEEVAREKRYEFFQDEAAKLDIKNLLLAHNLNDKVETVLFRIFRGTNIAGLSGISQERIISYLRILRPLLETSRDIIEAYALKNSLEYFEDKSNEDLKYSRNRIRHKILPEALEINPKVLNNVNKLSKIVEEQSAFIEQLAEKALAELGAMPWDLAEFQSFDKVLQRKILETKFTSNMDFVEDFIKAIEQGGFHRINFKKGSFFTIKQKKIHLELND